MWGTPPAPPPKGHCPLWNPHFHISWCRRQVDMTDSEADEPVVRPAELGVPHLPPNTPNLRGSEKAIFKSILTNIANSVNMGLSNNTDNKKGQTCRKSGAQSPGYSAIAIITGRLNLIGNAFGTGRTQRRSVIGISNLSKLKGLQNQ